MGCNCAILWVESMQYRVVQYAGPKGMFSAQYSRFGLIWSQCFSEIEGIPVLYKSAKAAWKDVETYRKNHEH